MPLTKSENRVANLVAVGYSDKETADMLSVSTRTVVNHKSSIYEKLGINKATELTNYIWCRRMNIDFDLNELRKQAIAFGLFLCLLPSIGNFDNDMNRAKRSRSGRSKTKRETII